MELVVDLADVDATMLEAVGGKAVNLGVMITAGLPVPGGFCVTTEAYRSVLGTALDDLVAALDGTQDQSIAERLRRRIETRELPLALVGSIVAHYRRLGPDVPVAVRSSATAEDLPYASFAGQQDTYLNVVGEAAVLDAVRRCWASLWTERAVSYRRSQGIDHQLVRLAVVGQRMVDATVAGVMFTANPVTGTRHETVIDAGPGLGESVVSGAVTPDHFVVDRSTASITERRLGDLRSMITSRPGGGTEQHDRDAGQGPCLDDAQVLALSALGQHVQDLYAAPQDTEWAIDRDDGLWLTQARPITTLYPLVGHGASRTDGPGRRVLLCLSLAQGLTRPITPLGFAAFRLIGSSVADVVGVPRDDPRAGPRALHDLGQRVYLDVTPLLRHRFGRRLLLAALSVMEARAAAVLRRLSDEADFAVVASPPGALVRPLLRIVARTGLPVRVAVGLVSPRAARWAIRRTERRLRASLDAPETLDARQRLDFVERRLGRDVFLLMPTVFPFAAGGFVCLALARRLLVGLADPTELQQALRSLPDNVTTEMDLALWRLTEQIRADDAARTVFGSVSAGQLSERYRGGELPRVAQQGLADFLDRYGHRAVAEIDLGMPRWAEDPAHLVGVIANYLRQDDPALAPDRQFVAGRRAAEAMIGTLVGRARARGRLRGAVVGWCLRRARALTGLRETPKFLLVLALAALREHLATVGRELADRGRIAAAEDVFFLDLGQARAGLAGMDLRPVVVERRAAYAQELRRRRVPRVLLSDGTEPEAVARIADRPDGALVGSPASAGTVTGTARVVLDPAGAQLEPGEILVAPSTDPGWTPLFLTAGALVMEMGGPNSHGAVVAREYGIPAVVGVPDATHQIVTGQRITVDGAAGLVFGTPDGPAGHIPV